MISTEPARPIDDDPEATRTVPEAPSSPSALPDDKTTAPLPRPRADATTTSPEGPRRLDPLSIRISPPRIEEVVVPAMMETRLPLFSGAEDVPAAMMIAPAVSSAALPVESVKLPVLPSPSLDPVLNTISPVPPMRAVAAESDVLTAMLPLEKPALEPLATLMLPPVPIVLAPAASCTSPPTSIMECPAARVTLPPLPDMAADPALIETIPPLPLCPAPTEIVTFPPEVPEEPVFKSRDPLGPTIVAPVLTLTPPLAPRGPARADSIDTAPVVSISLFPLRMRTSPPASIDPRPPVMETAPPALKPAPPSSATRPPLPIEVLPARTETAPP